jgi:hypothetical protein
MRRAKPDAGSTISVKLLLLSVAAGTKDLAEAEDRTHPPDTAVVIAVVVFALLDSGGSNDASPERGMPRAGRFRGCSSYWDLRPRARRWSQS